jgi:hypothetical protein
MERILEKIEDRIGFESEPSELSMDEINAEFAELQDRMRATGDPLGHSAVQGEVTAEMIDLTEDADLQA